MATVTATAPLASFDCDTWDDLAAARARIREHGTVLDQWITAVKNELGIDVDVDTKTLLDLARDAAHGVARPAAPLTTFLIGYAAARAEAAGADPAWAVAEASRKAADLALRWDGETPRRTPKPAPDDPYRRRARPGRSRLPGPEGSPGSSADQALDEALALVSRTPDGGGHRAAPWLRAREAAVRAGSGVRARSHRVPLPDALGEVLTAPLDALTDLPSFDTSAMDGWAVAGPGPWAVRDGGVLAGSERPEPLADGEAVRIATGARIPADTTAVIRSEHSREAGSQLFAERPVATGQDIRPRGQECRSGDLLLPAGSWSPRRCSAWRPPRGTTRWRPGPGRAWRSWCSATSC